MDYSTTDQRTRRLILRIHDLAAVLDGGCHHAVLRHVRGDLAFRIRHHTTHAHVRAKLVLDQLLDRFDLVGLVDL